MQGTRVFAVAIPEDPSAEDARRLLDACPLSRGRRDKTERFRRPADRMRSIAAELLLARALSDLGLEAPVPLGLSEGPYGKPRLDGRYDIEFNLSHSGRFVVCAVSERPVGIDIERAADVPMGPLLGELCSDGERAALESYAEAERRERFFLLWTAKESVAKALGLGLSLPLRSIELDPSRLGGDACPIAAESAKRGGFRLDFPRVAPGYACCTASEPGSDFVGLTRYAWADLLP